MKICKRIHQSIDIFSNHLPVVENGLFDAFLDGMRMNMVYEDDYESETDWERYPGAAPRLGFSSTGLPHDAIELMNAVPKLTRVRVLGSKNRLPSIAPSSTVVRF